MTIEEAIKHCREVAQDYKRIGSGFQGCSHRKLAEKADECNLCAAEHEQLAEWLTELQEKRCKVIVQANRIKELEEKLGKQESPQRACTTCGKRTRCPGPASGRSRTGCSFWSAREEEQE